MAQNIDLSLPPSAPELGKYNRYIWCTSSFAVYSLVEMSEQTLHAIVSRMVEDLLDQYEDWEVHLVQVAPDHDFAGRSLQEVLQAHVSLIDKTAQEVKWSDYHTDGDLRWFPAAFIVLTSDNILEGKPLFVYADAYDEVVGGPLDKFYFRVEDAHDMLSSLRLGHELFTESKETYAIDGTNG